MTKATFAYFSWCPVCEFAMVLGVYISLCPQEEKVHSSSWGHKYTHSAAQSSKRFKPLPVTIVLWQVIVELEKIQIRNLSVFMVLVIWQSSTLKFLFVFDFKKNIWWKYFFQILLNEVLKSLEKGYLLT